MRPSNRTSPVILFLALIGLLVVLACGCLFVGPFVWTFVTQTPPPWLP